MHQYYLSRISKQKILLILEIKYLLSHKKKRSNSVHTHWRWQNTPYGILMTERSPGTMAAFPIPTAHVCWSVLRPSPAWWLRVSLEMHRLMTARDQDTRPIQTSWNQTQGRQASPAALPYPDNSTCSTVCSQRKD